MELSSRTSGTVGLPSPAAPVENGERTQPAGAPGLVPTPVAAPDQVPLWQRAETSFVAWRHGEQGALDDLVRTLTPVLWHVVRAYGLDRDSADDVVQTTWLTLVRNGDSVRDERAVLRWLTTVARREAWRVSQSSRRTQTGADEVLEAVLPTTPSAEAEVVVDDQQRLLWALVGQLSERCQRLLRVVAFCEHPDYAGFSASTGMPIGSIGPTRARCLAKLRALVESEGGTR